MVPADLLLLDSSSTLNKESTSYISSSLTTGKSTFELKKACFLTKCGKCPSPHSPKRPDFSLKIEYFKQKNNDFSGYLQLFNDPKIEKLSHENFIEKGSIVKRTNWIIGLVLFCGKDTRIMKNTRFFNFSKNSLLEQNSQIFFIVFFLIAMICAIFAEIMFHSIEINKKTPILKQNMNHILLLVVIFPLDFYYLSEVWFIYVKFFLEYSIYKKTNKKILINSPNLISDLAHIDYAIFDKTGTLSKKNKRISMIFSKTTGKIYKFLDFQVFLNKLHKKKTLCSFETSLNKEKSPLLQSPIELLDIHKLNKKFVNFQKNEKNPLNCIFSYKDLIKEHLCHPEGKPSIFHDILLAYLLCQIPQQPNITPKNSSYKFSNTNSKLLNSLVNSLDYHLLEPTKIDQNIYFRLQAGQTLISYKILGFHRELDQFAVKPFFGIILQDPKTMDYILYVSGSALYLNSKLIVSEQYSHIIHIFNKKGVMNPLLYAKRQLTITETEIFIDKYHNLRSSLINQTDYLIDLFENLLYDLELLSIVAYEDILEEKSCDLIKFFKEIGINSWILSGDIQENVYSVASRINIFDEEAEQLLIDSEKLEDLFIQTKKILISLNKQIRPLFGSIDQQPKKSPIFKNKTLELTTLIEEKFDKYIFINGESFDIILTNEYLFSHFCFICQIIRTVIGYNFSDFNKKRFVEIIQKKFSKKSTVLAIGDGFNDIMMLSVADIGVEMGKTSWKQSKNDEFYKQDTFSNRIDVISNQQTRFSSKLDNNKKNSKGNFKFEGKNKQSSKMSDISIKIQDKIEKTDNISKKINENNLIVNIEKNHPIEDHIIEDISRNIKENKNLNDVNKPENSIKKSIFPCINNNFNNPKEFILDDCSIALKNDNIKKAGVNEYILESRIIEQSTRLSNLNIVNSIDDNEVKTLQNNENKSNQLNKTREASHIPESPIKIIENSKFNNNYNKFDDNIVNNNFIQSNENSELSNSATKKPNEDINNNDLKHYLSKDSNNSKLSKKLQTIIETMNDSVKLNESTTFGSNKPILNATKTQKTNKKFITSKKTEAFSKKLLNKMSRLSQFITQKKSILANKLDYHTNKIKKNKESEDLDANMMLGDIILNDFSNLKELITISGCFYDKYSFFIKFSFYKSFLYGLSLFIFVFYDEFYSNCLYDPILSLFFYGYFNMICQLVSMIFFEIIPEKLRKEFIELYYEGKFQRKLKQVFKNIFFVILEGFIIQSTMVLITLFAIRDLINFEGFYGNFNSLGLILTYSIVIYVQINVFF